MLILFLLQWNSKRLVFITPAFRRSTIIQTKDLNSRTNYSIQIKQKYPLGGNNILKTSKMWTILQSRQQLTNSPTWRLRGRRKPHWCLKPWRLQSRRLPPCQHWNLQTGTGGMQVLPVS
jgi:hypothetical protein